MSFINVFGHSLTGKPTNLHISVGLGICHIRKISILLINSLMYLSVHALAKLSPLISELRWAYPLLSYIKHDKPAKFFGHFPDMYRYRSELRY
jgi:hypothetical protein